MPKPEKNYDDRRRQREPFPRWVEVDCTLHPQKLLAWAKPVKLKAGTLVSVLRPLPPRNGRSRAEIRVEKNVGWVFSDQLADEEPKPAPEATAPAPEGETGEG